MFYARHAGRQSTVATARILFVRLLVASGLWLVAIAGHSQNVNVPPPLPAPARTEVTGELEVFHDDYPDNTSRTRYFLKTLTGRLGLDLQSQVKAPEQHTGSKVRVSGWRRGDILTVDAAGILVLATSKSAAVPNTFGEQRTLVMLVNFQDKPSEPYTLADAHSVVFGTTSDFFRENSYGQTWLAGDVVGWYTIPLASTTCNTFSIATYAEAAATAAGVNLSAYTRYVYAFPQIACAFSGSASVGGNPSRAYIHGAANMDLGTVGHELGHNLGLQHSHAWVPQYSASCPTGTTAGAIIGDCYQLESGDLLDIMGGSDSGHFNAPQKERLGWLNYGASPPVTTVTSSGTYTLAPYETTGVVLAAHAAAAIMASRQSEQLESALSTRDRIGQAKGIIMERFGVDDVRAFEMLRRLSQDSNTPLVDVARRVIETRGENTRPAD